MAYWAGRKRFFANGQATALAPGFGSAACGRGKTSDISAAARLSKAGRTAAAGHGKLNSKYLSKGPLGSKGMRCAQDMKQRIILLFSASNDNIEKH